MKELPSVMELYFERLIDTYGEIETDHRQLHSS